MEGMGEERRKANWASSKELEWEGKSPAFQ